MPKALAVRHTSTVRNGVNNMRILFVSECYPSEAKPQYGIFIKQQEQALRDLGHEVDVLVPALTGKDTSVKERQAGLYDLQYRNIRYDIFPLLASPNARKGICDLIGEKQYDLVAVHITGDGVLKMTVKACNELGIPVVAHYHGLNVWEEYETGHPHRQKLYADRRRRILQKAQGVVGVSDKVSEIARTRLINVPVHTVYNGVNTELFAQRKPNGDCFKIIGVGNLIGIKGFTYLLQAFAKLHEQMPESRLDIVGEGVLMEALREEAQVLGVADAVCLTGRLPYEQVARKMAESDLFVLPSFYEALGCVYLEAMGCGLPTIGVYGMGIDEIIRHDENGLLVNPKDSNDLYEKMLRVAKDAALAEKLSKQGRETALTYTWANSAKTLEKVYEEILAK